jgi:hypothetical protein
MATPKDSSNPAATYSRPEATTATAAAGKPPRHPEPDATAPGGGEKTHPPERKGAAQPHSRSPCAGWHAPITAAVACGMPLLRPPPYWSLPIEHLIQATAKTERPRTTQP